MATHDGANSAANLVAPLDFDLTQMLEDSRRSGSKVTDAHLRVVETDLLVSGTKTTAHCYSLTLDGNGRVRYKPLAEFLRYRIVDYAIPRHRVEEAIQEASESQSSAAFAKLDEEARRLFTHLAKSGEGGELLLFAMAEAVFGLAQLVCKMSLKTSTTMHYHGSDGIYVDFGLDEILRLY